MYFRCDEKYSPGNHCKSKVIHELRVLLVNGAEEIELLQGTPSEEAKEIPIPDVGELVELDLKLVIGFFDLRHFEIKSKVTRERVWCSLTVGQSTISFLKG